MFHGFLNLSKPAGLTSHDCVSRTRRLLNMKKVGHGGTLDPAATGVLPIALGQGTRFLNYLPVDKAYRARICFGVVTRTDDLEGEILQSRSASHIRQADIES
ncbi:MAG: tRNA pseudouridine(55) synthase TruB, partial [Cyanobacteria bacterium P01_F01_bin.42]